LQRFGKNCLGKFEKIRAAQKATTLDDVRALNEKKERTFMKQQSVSTILIEVAIAISCIPFSVEANGFRLPNQDAFAAGRGVAFVATADNPSAVYYNPAGISQLEGQRLRVGMWALNMESTYRSPENGSFENERRRHAIPQFFYTFSPKELPLSFGLGVFAPFGLSMRWPDDTGFRTLATQGSLEYLTINPVVAWKIQPNLSIGAGLTFNRASLNLQQGVAWPDQAFDGFEFSGNGWDAGFNLGALWKPHEKVSLGVSFRSQTTIDLEGKTEYYNAIAVPPLPPSFPGITSFPKNNVDADARFPFPSMLIVGISYRPTPDWNLEFNADYTDWDRVGTVKIKQARGFGTLIPQDVPVTLEWHSSWYYELGVTRYIGDAWSISAGYVYNENSVPDKYYSPLVADLNRNFLTIGAGYKGQSMSFDIAYQYGFAPERTVSGSSPSSTGQTADGGYKYKSNALIASLGWRF
jgi:long-chain fatty acid transport protein